MQIRLSGHINIKHSGTNAERLHRPLHSILKIRNTASETVSSNFSAVNKTVPAETKTSYGDLIKPSIRQNFFIDESQNKYWEYHEAKSEREITTRLKTAIRTSPGYLAPTAASRAKIVDNVRSRQNTANHSADRQTLTLPSSLRPSRPTPSKAIHKQGQVINPEKTTNSGEKNYLKPTLASLAKSITGVSNQNRYSVTKPEMTPTRKCWDVPQKSHSFLTAFAEKMHLENITDGDNKDDRSFIPTRS